MHRYDSREDGLSITVTRHAAERFIKRTRRAISLEKASRVIARAILEAVRWGELIAIETGAWLAPVTLEGGGMVFGVVALSGPSEKPCRVEVRTVLTDDMAGRSHGHFVGVGRHLAA